MSFLCNVAAGQHTPKSILESSEPRDVTLAPALTRTATVQLAGAPKESQGSQRYICNTGSVADISPGPLASLGCPGELNGGGPGQRPCQSHIPGLR